MFSAIVLTMVIAQAQAITIKEPFVFVDRFPDESKQLGFTPGNVVQLGAHVTPSDSPITEATGRNLDTGLSSQANLETDWHYPDRHPILALAVSLLRRKHSQRSLGN
jgi:hypothetical protein